MYGHVYLQMRYLFESGVCSASKQFNLEEGAADGRFLQKFYRLDRYMYTRYALLRNIHGYLYASPLRV